MPATGLTAARPEPAAAPVPPSAAGYAIAMFATGLLALSYPMAWLRLRTGSVWPAVIMHSSGNAVLYLAADPLTRGGRRRRPGS